MRWLAARLVCLSLSLGCAGPQPAPVRAPRASLRDRAPRPSAPCEIRGAHATAVRVAVPGREPLVVNVRQGALRVSAGSDPTEAHVRVTAPLRFRGTLDPAAQSLSIVGGGTFAAGGLELAPGSRLISLERREGALEAWVQLGRPDLATRRGLELAAGPVRVRCADLSLDRRAARSAPPRPVPGAPLRVAEGSLALRPVRIAPRTLTLRPQIGPIVAAHLLDSHGAWARVEARFADGTRARGWTEAAALRAPSDGELERLEGLFEEPPAPQREVTLPDLPPPPPTDATEYVGRALMNAQAPVFAVPGEGAWARGPSHPIEVTVRQASGARFSELLTIPGLELDRPVWVRSAALRIDR